MKPAQFKTHEEVFNNCFVSVHVSLQSVKSIVEGNRSRFEVDIGLLEDAEDLLKKFGPQEDAWALISPETELQRDECKDKQQDGAEDSDEECNVPDLQCDKKDEKIHVCDIEAHSSRVPKSDALNMMRSLNDKQKTVFYKMRQWCLDKANGKKPDALQVLRAPHWMAAPPPHLHHSSYFLNICSMFQLSFHYYC